MAIEEVVDYPVKDILTDLAQSHGVPIRNFTQEYFLPEAQTEHFPFLCDLSGHLVYSHGVGIEIVKDGMVAFEGSQNGVSLAYFSRRVRRFSANMKEQCLVHSRGRRIHRMLNENGQGRIELQDLKVREARLKLGDESFGSSYDEHPTGSYGFKQEGCGKLQGVKGFLEMMLT